MWSFCHMLLPQQQQGKHHPLWYRANTSWHSLLLFSFFLLPLLTFLILSIQQLQILPSALSFSPPFSFFLSPLALSYINKWNSGQWKCHKASALQRCHWSEGGCANVFRKRNWVGRGKSVCKYVYVCVGGWACRKQCAGPCDCFGLPAYTDMFFHTLGFFLTPPSALVCVQLCLQVCSSHI